MNNLRMVVAGTYTPTCVSVNVAPDFGSGSDWEQRTYSDADAPVVVVDEASPGVLYWQGYNASMRGSDLAEMETDAEREGWFDAKADAEDTNDYEDWLEDIEWFSRGQW